MKKCASLAVSLMLAVAAVTTIQVNSASAAPAEKYSSCAKLTKDFPHGVARSKRAASKQVAQGYGRPAYRKKAKRVYRQNRAALDRDKDGTACER
ncbi:MAG: excalibur calcium-binding domain-containing protein [Nocardioides sp.]